MYWINGVLKNELSLNSRIIHSGDGFFTTARIFDGKIHLLHLHLDRLSESANRLSFKNFDLELIKQDIFSVIQKKMCGVIKIIIVRDNCDVYHKRVTDCNKFIRIISIIEHSKKYSHWKKYGIEVDFSPITLGRDKILAGIKHTNRLKQVLIQSFIERSSIDEAIVLDNLGYVIECCNANIFWRKGKKVFTPSLNFSGVTGIMRKYILSILPKIGFRAFEVMYKKEKFIDNVDEVFITNALLPVAPVKKLNKKIIFNRYLSNLLLQKIKFK